MLKYIFTAAFILCAQWSMAEPLPLVPTLNNAVGANPYVSAKQGWVEVLASTAREKAQIPTFAEWAQHYGTCLIRNGLMTSAPMPINQQELILARAAANPDDANLAAKADISAFIRGCKLLRERGVKVGQYVGAPWRYDRKGNETIPAWSHRLRQELVPQLAHCDFIIFDNTQGSSEAAYGAWKAAAVRYFLTQLHRDMPDLEILGEPAWWSHDREWCADFGSFLSCDFLGNQLRRSPDAIATWPQRKPSGSWPGDPSDMLVPGITGSPVMMWLDFRSTGLFEGDPKKESLRYLTEYAERMPHASLACPHGWIPRGLIER